MSEANMTGCSTQSLVNIVHLMTVKKLTTKMGMHNQATNQLKAQMLVWSCLQQLSLCKH